MTSPGRIGVIGDTDCDVGRYTPPCKYCCSTVHLMCTTFTLDYVVLRALLTCTACTFLSANRGFLSRLPCICDLHGMYYIVVYRALLICTACTIISFPAFHLSIISWSTTTTSSSDYLEYVYSTLHRLPLGEESSDFVGGIHLLRMFTLYNFVPFPTERLMNGNPTPV